MNAGSSAQLNVDSIACRRGGRMLFKGLSFELREGEIQQVIGPNGSGKTTLLRILCGLRVPDEGCVRWGEQTIEHADDGFLGSLSYLGVQSGLKLDLTPIENLDFARTLANACHLDPAGALAKVQLTDYADTPCRRMSTGQLRRVALARLLMQQTKLWILDEPLTGLDRASRSDFELALLWHADAGGMVVMTTHQPLSGHAMLRQLELGH